MVLRMDSLFEERDLAELVVCWALQRYTSRFAEGQWFRREVDGKWR